MKVVLLAGGFGTRISEESQFKPKPMVELGGMPILWHIMKLYSHHGFNEFIICAGYKQHVIKEYFADYFLHTSDITYDFTNGRNEMTIHRSTLAGDCGKPRAEHHDRRACEAGAGLHRKRAFYADLWRRCVRPGYHCAG